MAVMTPASPIVNKNYRRQALIWLLMTLIFGVVLALVWMFSKTPVASEKIKNAPVTATTATPVDMVQPIKIDALHELDGDVQPIDFDAMVRDLRQYPKEFKDKRFLIANKGKWTVQVMNVAENDVILDYLSGREDRDKFAYFRYRDENDQPRFMLTYGIMSSPQEAMGASQLIDFGLPANVRVLPEEFNRYVSIIENYELADPVVDLGANGNRKVKLQPTRQEVPVRRSQPASAANESSNSNNSSASRAASAAETTSNANSDKSIRQSANPAETLVVQEERVVNVDGEKVAVPARNKSTTTKEDSSQAEKSKSSDKKTSESVGNNKEAKEKAAKNEAEKPTNKSSDTAQSPAKSADSIKELIQEKSN